jgi:hypothetical protein
MIFQGFTSKIAFQLTKGVCSAPTFKLFCFWWEKFVKFILNEEIECSWDSPEVIINTYMEL